ncbi:MAG: arginine--tRNA ligase [Campylobacterota bacterium]|nr:arginine--tRNA ligase [Campylobacterota bacterium]
MKLKEQISRLIADALTKASIDAESITVAEATKPEFGDYQFNGIMPLAKQLKRNPREIATEVASLISIDGVLSKVEVAGPGFINLWLDDAWLGAEAGEILSDERVGVEVKDDPVRVVVDYSGPNMAKEMHVGHLRSTIIGDTLANLLSFLGDEVIRQNHIGDWGTQFGMLIAYLEEIGDESGSENLKDLEQFYKNSKRRFDEDEAFADRAREYVVKIQSGDAHCLRLWQKFIDISLGHCEEIYDKLDINLSREDVRAESFYNERLPQVIDIMDERGVVQISQGAKCIFLDGEEIPLIVQKGDGGYLYATTDLAALWYRWEVLGAKRVSYVVDARQGGHFNQVFQVAKESELVSEDTLLEHVAFGTMMDKSGKPFKTRDGGTVKLIELLDEAVVRAREAIKDRDEYDSQALETLAKTIGIGAVKYADLSINRESNYIFDWDKMLSLDGNTSLYQQYAYARIMSIFRRYGGTIGSTIVIGTEIEHRLALLLLRFEDILIKAAKDTAPHQITSYLYDVTTLFMRFYEQNPILKDGVERETRESRLALSALTANVIKQGLSILGIGVVERL